MPVRFFYINVPALAAGWNRCSCAMCIFSLPRHWAGIRELFPDWVRAVEEDERVLGFTLDNKMPLAEYIGDAAMATMARYMLDLSTDLLV